jgi:hypothetical protein
MRGDLAQLQLVSHDRGPALVKLVRDPRDNDLIEREAVALRQLASDGEERFRAYVPRLFESFRHRDADTGVLRRANVISHLPGFSSLAEVRAAMPEGVDPRDAAWMWRRLLVALGFAHRAGVVHGAVLPVHIMIHPGDHGLALVDWCYSVPSCYAQTDPSGLVPAIVTRFADWYPAEVAARRPASPGTDIFMAARCMTELMGDRIPRALSLFARGCRLRAPRRRPADAWALLGELDELLERLYGPRTFRPFTIPALPGTV